MFDSNNAILYPFRVNCNVLFVSQNYKLPILSVSCNHKYFHLHILQGISLTMKVTWYSQLFSMPRLTNSLLRFCFTLEFLHKGRSALSKKAFTSYDSDILQSYTTRETSMRGKLKHAFHVFGLVFFLIVYIFATSAIAIKIFICF